MRIYEGLSSRLKESMRARPTFFDHLHQLFGNVHAPAIIPTIFKPARQLFTGIVIEYVDVQFTLLRKTGESQIAAAEITDGGIVNVGTKEQIEFGVQGMTQEQLDQNFLGFDLGAKPAQPGFVFISGRTDCQLLAKLLRQSFFRRDTV
jgi:hypothetical protein